MGRYHWRKFHDIVNSFGPSVLDDEEITLPEMLKTRGYQTACIGKWHLGWDWKSNRVPDTDEPRGGKGYDAAAFDWEKPIADGPCDHGFDYYFGDDVPNFPPYTWIENDRVLTAPTESLKESPATAEGAWECRPGPMARNWQLDAVMPKLTEKAVEWIHQQPQSGGPFFLYMPFTSPHAPIVPSQDFIGTSEAGGYGDFMQQTDDTVGQIIAALKSTGHLQNTLIIFSSDNGPEIYALERLRKFEHSSMSHLRGIKRSIWEGGHRVPMIVAWPGQVPAGTTCDHLFSQIDIYRTLAKIVAGTIPDGMAQDSLDQSPLFYDANQPAIRTELVHNTYPQHYALRSNQWLYLAASNGDERNLPQWYQDLRGYPDNPHQEALFDLSTDLEQKRDVAALHPDLVNTLRRRLQTLNKSN
jgi:arylsulfatase A